jgi:hypothetical protein
MSDQHKEAFALMWYACPCGHQERFWNSRDGVTPFMTRCPSCGKPEMQHVRWREDQRDPDHKPHFGQRVWIDMTAGLARELAEKRVSAIKAAGREVRPGLADALFEDIFRDGTAPSLRVQGYKEAP